MKSALYGFFAIRSAAASALLNSWFREAGEVEAQHLLYRRLGLAGTLSP
jgi:hypothetical protein